MNKRIKELAEQAGFYFYDMHNVDGQDLGETVEADSWRVPEAFAKLIVKECIENIHDINEDFNHGNIFINNKKLQESVTSDYAIYTNKLAESIIKRFIELLQKDAEPEDFIDGKLWVDDDLVKSTVN